MVQTSYGHLVNLAIVFVFAIAAIWAVVVTLIDKNVRASYKVIWTFVLLVIPAIGFVMWLIARIVERQRRVSGRHD